MVFQGAPEIICSGSPHEIGLAHGSQARERIAIGISNYTRLFAETAQIDWSQACQRAEKFIPGLEKQAPDCLAEMRGIAEGAGVPFLDILALNVRSEIALTHYTDGCTSLAKVTEDSAFLAQNWDWVGEASLSTVFLDIRETGKPRIQMMGEAGLVGKFGFNECGVGVCMNAIRAGALDVGMLPVHVAIRKVLECKSYGEARAVLDDRGVAACVNLMIADRKGAFETIECTPRGNTVIIQEEDSGAVVHTNHLYASKLVEDQRSANTYSRLARMQKLCRGKQFSYDSIRSWLSDDEGSPTAICRVAPPGAVGMERMETLATIIMDLKDLTAQVSFGRPNLNPEIKHLSF